MSVSPGSLPTEVFLSFSSQDRPIATAVAATLRAHGLAVWYSETNIRGAQQWHDEIGRALTRCDWFVLLLSEHAVKSRWVRREFRYALEAEQYDNRILPVLIEACDPFQLSWTLSATQHVDMTTSFEDGCRAILRTWGLGLDSARLQHPEKR